MTGIILAGGKSTRMGSSKALLNIGGKTVVQRVIEVLQTIFPQIIIVANDEETYRHLGYPIVGDIISGYGPLGGLHAGLTASSSEVNFLVACDMPLLQPALIRFMISQTKDYDAVLPKSGPYLEPLHAVYKRSCLPAVEKVMAAGRKKVTSFFDDISINYLEEEELVAYGQPKRAFLNVNTPEDWLTVRKLLQDLEE
ncbi:molybdenum cofactor guanylyltransferase [Metallumcola ferriviriculae]|uniref:Probable molybdenum cofactor guanylyltransferase n=1 Tax=Metallumcola ferriviriculae TaxID=3039180 RepID=A0AAU0UM64_9FIRM|nr:molybdenum cofactor guanylyltransferase [Desulfitibacteraceae bacterium MK1]